ncbi:hypothetical protein FRC01_004091 [Tulasnella sp. 417]|nr:hypothetical protein FRC01_004091 [Tulasnella sp. 417]
MGKQTLQPTDDSEPSEHFPIHLFEPNSLRTARHHFRAALRVDGRNTLAYGFLVLLRDEMVQQRQTKSHSSTLRFSDSDEDQDEDAPTPILPLSAFVSPPSPSETEGLSSRLQTRSGWEKTTQGPNALSTAYGMGGTETLASTASPLSDESPLPKASSPEELGRTSSATHVEAGNLPDHRNVPPILPPKSTLDRAEYPYGASTTRSVPSNSSTPAPAPSDIRPRRLGISRASSTSHSSSVDTSAASQRLSKSVRFTEAKSSEDEKQYGRKKKKIRR